MTKNETKDSVSPLKQALIKLDEMQSRIETLKNAKKEPIAIIGIGCRFPGEAHDTKSFWDLLKNGVDAIEDIPEERWEVDSYYDPMPNRPGKMICKKGAFLQNVDQFDCHFFGISPREAIGLDPQQRLLLETTWHALENGAIAPDHLKGSRTGVYIGVCTNDYSHLYLKSDDPEALDAYYGSGIAGSMASGRLSYVLGLQGPSLSIDTACSSSLVAVHLACQSLRSEETDMAIVGGVNLILSPENGITFSQSSMLAADGKCKTFDAAADGFAQGEGCGIVVLKPYSKALKDGNRIHALIRNSSVNQDGPSSGLTAPNGPAQIAVLKECYKGAGIDPRHVSYIEAHGTGTSLGDPIEVQALAEALCKERNVDNPLFIGSVKTNVGHLEASAGIAGLIKIVLSMQHKKIPPHLHYKNPSPHIAWKDYPIQVPTELMDWKPVYGKRIAGVSSFGFSGTNAHIAIEEALEIENHAECSGDTKIGWQALCLSAKSKESLVQLSKNYIQYIQSYNEINDVCCTVNAGRAHLSHRLSIVGCTREDLIHRLSTFIDGQNDESAYYRELDTTESPKVAFLFSGQGAQYPEMGRKLYESQPVFRETLNRCNEYVVEYLGESILAILYNKDVVFSGKINETQYTQAALFSIEYSLAVLWMSWGIRPSAVMGHSLGEYVAACVSGIMDLGSALRLVCERGRLMQKLPKNGKMAAIFSDSDTVENLIDSYRDTVSIASYNGPENTVISGFSESINAILSCCQERSIGYKDLRVSHAFHSPLVEPILDEFYEIASKINYNKPSLPIVSNVTGESIRSSEVCDAVYWRRHIRQSVQFEKSLLNLQKKNISVFLEIGPAPVLIGMGSKLIFDENISWLPSLRFGHDEQKTMASALAQCYASGVYIDWEAYYKNSGASWVDAPLYPFQRRRYWLDQKVKKNTTSKRRLPNKNIHPLLGQRTDFFSDNGMEIIYENEIHTDSLPFLRGHVVHGKIVFPTTAYLEIIHAAGHQIIKGQSLLIEDFSINSALLLKENEAIKIKTVLTRDESGEIYVAISSRDDSNGNESWTIHVEGKIKIDDCIEIEKIDLHSVSRNLTAGIDPYTFYKNLRQRGLEFGEDFQGINAVYPSNGKSYNLVSLAESLQEEKDEFLIHPAYLDACIQCLAAALPGYDPYDYSAELFMPIHVERIHLRNPLPDIVYSVAEVKENLSFGTNTVIGDICIVDESGNTVIQFNGFRIKKVGNHTLQCHTKSKINDWLYQIEWIEKPLPKTIVESFGSGIIQELSPISNKELKQSAIQSGLERYQQLKPEFNSLCAAYIVNSFLDMGVLFVFNEIIKIEKFINTYKILPAYGKLIRRYFEILSQVGVLKEEDQGWRVLRVPAWKNVESLYQSLLPRYESMDAELVLTHRCGVSLAKALRGEITPLELLFPNGDIESTSKVYTQMPTAKMLNETAGHVLSEWIQKWPEDQTLQVLEIGAGTGGLTNTLLPILAGRNTHYLFTDLGSSFLNRAKRKFASYSFIEYKILDIERSPVEQGFQEQKYDLVVASNVLHAVENIENAVKNATQLLKPKGKLLLLEGVTPQRWIDLTFGLTDGWWKFSDTELRPAYPLLSRESWQELLRKNEFTTQEFIRSGCMEHFLADHAVFFGEKQSTIMEENTILHDCKKKWLVFADLHEDIDEITESFKQKGYDCLFVYPSTEFDIHDAQCCSIRYGDSEHYERLFQHLFDQQNLVCEGIVSISPKQYNKAETLADLLSVENEKISINHMLCLLQTVIKKNSKINRGIYFVTRGAQPGVCSSGVQELSNAPVWGLRNVISLEHPEMNCKCIDLEDTETQSYWINVVEEVTSADDEEMVAFKNNKRYTARLQNYTQKKNANNESNVGLCNSTPGMIDGLHYGSTERIKPGLEEVEISVYATGMNFRDVLLSLGMYPDPTAPFGGECSGVITHVGKNVHHLKRGDAVIAVTPNCYGRFVTVSQSFVFKKPPTLTFEEAASIPCVFMTAYHSLVELAKLQPGERVLIHSGTGGVGLAAIQLANQIGAEVFATAGSEMKRRYLINLGVSHVMNSRTTHFAEEIASITHGKGVDVVLNSLSDEMIDKSLSIVSLNGRFIEIGKRGIRSEEQVRNDRSDIDYRIVDLSERILQNPESIKNILTIVLKEINKKTLSPLPCRVYHEEETQEAFRFMAQAKHIGKIVISRRDRIDNIHINKELIFKPDATYVITGGFKGLGLLTAEWLQKHGAGAIALIGRSSLSNNTKQKIAVLEDLGFTVRTFIADVADSERMQEVFEQIRESLPPIKGIFHSAGLLDDGVLMQQSSERFQRVMAPKVEGAWNLHKLTLSDELDWFVLYSSISSVLGSPGQGNHAAANSFLDALAHYRRERGLPGLSINWGVWEEIGSAAEKNVSGRVSAQGMGSFIPDHGLLALERLMLENPPQAAVMPINWPLFLKEFGRGHSPFFTNFYSKTENIPVQKKSSSEDSTDMATKIRKSAPHKQREMLLEHVRNSAAKVLGLDPAISVNWKQPLEELGLDSLMAVELRNLLGKSLGLARALPSTIVYDCPTVYALCDFIAKEHFQWENEPQEVHNLTNPTQHTNTVLDSIENLSDDEVEQLLANKTM